jgi:LPXTG-motif cell wall-anchored protein
MRRLRVPAVLAGVAALALVPAAPAFAIDPEVFTHADTTGVVSEGGATAKVDPIGLHFTTLGTDPPESRSNFYDYLIDPTILAAIGAAIDAEDELALATAIGQIETIVPLAFVSKLSYKTKKIDTTAGSEHILPAYKMEVFCDLEHPYTTLVYEPTLNGADPDTFHSWQTWQMDLDDGEFWSTFPLGGGFGGGGGQTKTLAEITDGAGGICPDGIVLSFQVGQGATTKPAEALADELYFAALAVENPFRTPEVSVAAVDGAPSSELFAIQHNWRGPLPQLPATGTDVTPYIVAGLTLIAVGSILVIVMRRRPVTA